MAESDIEKDRFLAEHADFRFREQVCYPNGGISRFYDNGTDMVVIDDGICSHEPKEPVFPYMLITERQNDYMHRFQRVFRFLGYARENLDSYLAKDGIVLEGGYIRNTGDRSEQADASPLEIHFEENFSSVYGMNALRYLTREYGICDENGRNYFLDYLSEQRIRNMRSKKTALITIIRKLLERKNIAISSRNKIRVPCGGSSYFAFPKRIANLPVGLRMISNSILEKILRILWMTESKLKEKLSCMNIRLSACRRYKSAEMRVSRHF